MATTAPGQQRGHGVEEPLGALDQKVRSACEDSFVSTFPPHVTRALLQGASEMTVAAGEVFYRGAEHAETAVLALIVDGLVRTYIRADNGRQVTIRYACSGDIVGVPALVVASAEDDHVRASWQIYAGHNLHAEALRDTTALRLSPDRFLDLARSEPSVGYALVRLLAHLTVETEEILEHGLFLSIRARVARHLLDLAVFRDGGLIVAEGHKEIAEAIGSVREVVSRTLVRLREEGIVDRRAGETLLVDPAALHAIAAEG